MKIIFDFDHTLFSAKKLYENLKEEFKKAGVSEKLFSETFQKSKGNFGHIPNKQLELIAKENPKLNLRMLKEKFKKVINRTDQFLYFDVLPALINLKKGNELIILSYGEKEFQREKIENTKITQYFSKVIVTPKINKTPELKKILENGESAIFVEDNPYALTEAKKALPQIITIRINRSEGPYIKEPNNEKIDFVIKNLSEIRKILEKLK